jgi:hypothetical protein
MSFHTRKQGANLLSRVITPWSWLQSATFPISLDDTVDEQVGAGADDAHETQTNALFSSTDNDANIIADADDFDRWSSGFRFQTVNVEKGVTVDTGCYFEGYCINNETDMNSHIYAEDVDDSADFSTTADVTDRTRTTANADWDATMTNNAFNGNTIEIQTVLQEIFDRDNWAANNDLTILIDGDDNGGAVQWAQFETYDSSTTNAAKLHVVYTAAGSAYIERGTGRGIGSGVMRGI